jgi:hypothetical protein
VSWQNQIFGNLPPPPVQHPASHGSAFGMNYQPLPTSLNIDDRRTGAPAATPEWMEPPLIDPFGPDPVSNSMDRANSLVDAGGVANPANPNTGAYSASFNRYFAPPPQPGWRQLPARPGPPPSLTLPYIDPHQPIAPGPAGWSPHNDSPSIGMPFTPEQMYAAQQNRQQGQITPEQMQGALNYWQGGAQ